RFSLTREEAERLWAVSAERPFLYRAGALGRLRGLALVPVKTVVRKLMRWYIEPLALDQRRFNAAVLKLVDALSERADAGQAALARHVDELHPRVEGQERRASELEERLTRLERRERPTAPRAASSALPAEPQVVF